MYLLHAYDQQTSFKFLIFIGVDKSKDYREDQGGCIPDLHTSEGNSISLERTYLLSLIKVNKGTENSYIIFSDPPCGLLTTMVHLRATSGLVGSLSSMSLKSQLIYANLSSADVDGTVYQRDLSILYTL